MARRSPPPTRPDSGNSATIVLCGRLLRGGAASGVQVSKRRTHVTAMHACLSDPRHEEVPKAEI
jgi:hypothetical protein